MLLRAAAGSAAGAATSVCYFSGLFRCVRCRNWLGGIRFLSLLLFATTSTLLLLLLLLKIILQARISFTNAQERSIPTYCTTVTTASTTATTTTAASGGAGGRGKVGDQPPTIPTTKLPPQHCKMPSEPFGRTLHVPIGRPY